MPNIKLKLTFALILSCALGLSGLRAQSNTEYGLLWTPSSSIGNFQASGSTTLTYSAFHPNTFFSLQTFSGISCGTGWGGGDVAKNSKNTTLAIQDDSSSNCTNMYFNGYFASKSREWQQAFDSLTRFIDSCPNNPHAPDAFSQISGAVAGIYGPTGGTYRATFLAWLESVLYLNTSDSYFCSDVEVMSSAMPLPADTAPGTYSREINIPLAVLRWLIQNTTCDTPQLAQEYDRGRETQLEQWGNNTTAYKLDTTLLPLDSIQPGLQELLEKHFLYADVSERRGPDIITNATASPNPLNTGTVISFGISKEAYVKIEVFDLLGNRVSSSGFESLFEPGNKAVPISLQGLPAGTYFARIVTAYGEVQTLKLVKD